MKKNIIAVLLAILTMSAFAMAEDISYSVKSGDNLYNIAKAHQVNLKTLIDHNRIKNPSLIMPGQIILIPDGVETAKIKKSPEKSEKLSSKEPVSKPLEEKNYFRAEPAEKEEVIIDHFECQDSSIIAKAEVLGFKYNTKEDQSYDFIEIIESMMYKTRYSQTNRFRIKKVRKNGETYYKYIRLDCSSFTYGAVMQLGARFENTSIRRNSTRAIFSSKSRVLDTKELETEQDNLRPGTALGWSGKHSYVYAGVRNGVHLFAHSSSRNRSAQTWKLHTGHINLASSENSIEFVTIEVIKRDMMARGRGKIYISVPDYSEYEYYVALSNMPKTDPETQMAVLKTSESPTIRFSMNRPVASAIISVDYLNVNNEQGETTRRDNIVSEKNESNKAQIYMIEPKIYSFEGLAIAS